jgi:DNA-binding transcriptional regulator LsrR (DeoR family)
MGELALHGSSGERRMEGGRTQKLDRKLDLAARAAWLYYIAGNTQDEIASKLNVSRQAAQRLVALAVTEKLIKFRLDHRLATTMVLTQALRDRFGLAYADVVPTDPTAESPLRGIAVAAAECLESWLGQRAPLVLAFSTGRTLRAAVEEVTAMTSPQHKIVSIIGAMSRDGRASPYEVVMRLAARVGAECFPLPAPVVASTVEERRLLQTQRSYAAVRELAERANATFVGIGEIAWNGPLHRDGFVTDAEVAELIDHGAVGEIGGWSFDADGRLIDGCTNDRVAGLPLPQPVRRLTIAVGGGRRKAAPILAALHGRLISGLITDEQTAQAVLAGT